MAKDKHSAGEVIQFTSSQTTVVDINSPKAMTELSTTLKTFVAASKLYTEIKGKAYVHVEGWQFAGATLGLYPVVKSLEQIINTDIKVGSSGLPEVKYRAEVEIIRLSTGMVVGRGIAICSNKEEKKKSFDEYAIASMAQTRATGKAFRLSLGWIMKLTGYEATPAEEMSTTYVVDGTDGDVAEVTENQMPIDDVKTLVNAKLEAMQPAERIRLLKDTVKALDVKKLTDEQYRLLYSELTLLANKAKEA